MIGIIFLVMLPLAWSYGPPNSQGGGGFAYVDSAGNRYGGTYSLKDGKVVSRTGDEFPQHFADNIPPFVQPFGDPIYSGGDDDFGEAYLSNLDNLLQEFPAFPSFPGFSMPPPITNYGNSAFASASAGPGYQHQVASIYPRNPAIPNVNHFADTAAPTNGGGFYSVSSKSYSSSANVNGQEVNNRGAETYVNDNGKVTHYKVQS